MKKLLRSSNRILGGVCGGIAEYFDVDPTVIRVAYALLSFFSAAYPGIVLYIILLVLIPDTQQIDNQ
jgi:phage shock protein C